MFATTTHWCGGRAHRKVARLGAHPPEHRRTTSETPAGVWLRGLQQRGAVLALSTLVSSASLVALPPAAHAETVRAVESDLTSSNERMISYRHQQHLWQTADGAFHLLVNRGTFTPGPGLTMYSSYDSGQTWAFAQAFANTGDKSTGDGQLSGDDLALAYNTLDGNIIFTQLHYDSVMRTWLVQGAETAFASTQWSGLNPTLAFDDLGTVWCGFLASSRSNSNSNLRVINRVGGGTVWTDPGLVFGPTDRGAQRSARLQRIPGGMGMVWTVREVTSWSLRPNGLPDNSAWQSTAIYTGVPTKPLEDPYASHFSLVADSSGTLHLITIENFDVLYFRYSLADGTWSSSRQVDDSRKVAYAQIGLTNGALGVAFSVQRGKGSLVVSPDLGTTWAATTELALLPAGPGINYNTARVEMPGQSFGPLPILQQYDSNGVQRLMLFKVPAP